MIGILIIVGVMLIEKDGVIGNEPAQFKIESDLDCSNKFDLYLA
jgi:hypothetical protein